MPIYKSAFEHADSAFFLFLQHCCIFAFVLHFGRVCPSRFFVNFVAEIGNEMHRKRNIFGHERVGSIGQKTMGTHTHDRCAADVSACTASSLHSHTR